MYRSVAVRSNQGYFKGRLCSTYMVQINKPLITKTNNAIATKTARNTKASESLLKNQEK